MSVGSIFSVLRAATPGEDAKPEDFLQPGTQQVCAGYAIYGPSTMLVLTLGTGTHAFTLDPQLGEWVLSHPNLTIPAKTREFAINASNSRFWEPAVKRYVDECLAGQTGPRGADFNMRWIASLVAETHRILMRGGVFMYPRDNKDPAKHGRLRLLYEANPISMLVEQAGGQASTGRKRMLEVQPEALHQRIGFIFGSSEEVVAHRGLPPRGAAGHLQVAAVRQARPVRDDDLITSLPGTPMSAKHPIIAITGSSGAGTTSVTRTFENIFRREKVDAAIIEGDTFHRYDRLAMKRQDGRGRGRGQPATSATSAPRRNLFEELEALFRDYAESGTGKSRKYLHDADEAAPYKQDPAPSRPGRTCPTSELLFYEGLHGGVTTDKVDIARYADLLIGVVPVINLEWIQKIHRDKSMRGYSTEAVTDVILRRMPDYVHYICPQFTRTHINFQRVPVVDTSDPFIARTIPTADESLVVIRFANPRGIDFPYLLSMLHDSFMSRANTLVVPGGKMELAMQLIFTPMILRLVERRKKALAN